MPDGNFQDYVALSGDTLSHKGAALQVGTNTASTVTFGMSNSAGMLAVVAAPTGNATLSLPNGGTVLTNVNFSAGTTSGNLSNVVLSNSNNVSFGLNGSTITASATVASTQGSFNVSAGTTSNLLSAVTFSNSNNVSFGLNASTITASVTVASTQASINVSAGTTSNLASAFTFGNANGVSFGINASTLTASIATSLTAVNLSAGTTSNNLSAFVFSNSNGVSFGLNGSTVTASVSPSGGAGVADAAGTQTATSGTVVFSNSNNVTFGMSNSSVVTASVTVASTQGSINLSAGTTSNLASAFTFGNANNVSFGLNASTITASIATSLTNINVSAGTTSGNLSAIVFSNLNGVSFGLNGSTITASQVGPGGIIAGTQTATNGSVVFSNSNGFTFGMSNSSVITLATSAGNVTVSNEIVFASEVSNTPSAGAATINWKAGNKQTVSVNAATVTLTFTNPDGPTNVLLRLVQDSTGGRLVAWTGGGLVINWVGGVAPTLSTAANAVDIVSLYWNGTAWYGSYGTGFGTSVVAVPVLTNINVSAGTTSGNLSNVVFSNANGVSFGLNGSTITASQQNNAVIAGTQTFTSGSVSFANSNGVTFGMSNSSLITASFSGFTRSRHFPLLGALAVATQHGQGTLHVHPMQEPGPFQFDRVFFDINWTQAAVTTTGGVTISMIAGLYTRNGSTLSLLASQTTAAPFTYSTTNSSLFVGGRIMTMGWTTTVPFADIWMAIGSSTATAGINSVTISQYAASDVNSNFSGILGVASATSAQDRLGLGYYSAATAGLPNSIAFSQIQGTNSNALRIPLYGFISGTA